MMDGQRRAAPMEAKKKPPPFPPPSSLSAKSKHNSHHDEEPAAQMMMEEEERDVTNYRQRHRSMNNQHKMMASNNKRQHRQRQSSLRRHRHKQQLSQQQPQQQQVQNDQMKHQYEQEVLDAITKLQLKCDDDVNRRVVSTTTTSTIQTHATAASNITKDVIEAVTSRHDLYTETRQQRRRYKINREGNDKEKRLKTSRAPKSTTTKTVTTVNSKDSKRNASNTNNNKKKKKRKEKILQVDEVIAAVRKNYCQLEQQDEIKMEVQQCHRELMDKQQEEERKGGVATCGTKNVDENNNEKIVNKGLRGRGRRQNRKIKKQYGKGETDNTTSIVSGNYCHDGNDDESVNGSSLHDDECGRVGGNDNIAAIDNCEEETKKANGSNGNNHVEGNEVEDSDNEEEDSLISEQENLETITSTMSNIITVTTTDEEDNINILPQTLFTSATRTDEELKTQRRRGIKIQTLYSYSNNRSSEGEEEHGETIECNLECEGLIPNDLYRFQFCNKLLDDEEEVERENQVESNDDANGGLASGGEPNKRVNLEKEKTVEEIKIGANDLGMNGWHRILPLLQPSIGSNDDATLSSTSSFNKLILNLQALKSIGESDHISNNGGCKSGRSYNNTTTKTLDQLTAINILENPHHPQYVPVLSEEDALRDEYETLQREIISLERDRMALECQFNETDAEKCLFRLKAAGRESSTRYGLCSSDERRSYHQFRQKIRYMQNEDLLSLPSMLWKEDIPLEPPRSDHYQNRRRNNNNNNRRYRNDNNSIMTKIDEGFQTSVREHRGAGLALLIADANCRNALIGHCYTRFYMNQQREEKEEESDEAEKPIMRVEGVVTMIQGGGKYLRYCGLIGHTTLSTDDDEDDQNNTKKSMPCTSYFLKFDGGKSYHHGMLPSNLMKRLSREKRELKSIRYLSTGPLLFHSSSSSSSDTSDGTEARCYYLEFDNGESLWAVPTPNDELESLLREVDVHRVAFGSSLDSIGDNKSSSWIVITKDGSVYYKNIPQGLHDALTSRVSNVEPTVAPCEVSLGQSGSYFIRFLDGSVDYNLPKYAADVFETFESNGLQIRNVCLHVDTADCIIRFH